MANEEVLRAVLYAQQNVSKALRNAADGVREAREAMVEAGVSAASLSESMDQAEAEGRQFASAADEVGDEALGTRARLASMAESMDGVRNAVAEAVPSLVSMQSATDEVGDEALDVRPKLGAMSEGLDGVRNAAASMIPSLLSAQQATDEVGDEALGTRARLASMAETAGDVRNAVASAVPSLLSMQSATDEVGDEALGTRARLAAMSEGIDSVRNAALAAIPTMVMLGATIDEAGDEATGSIGELLGLSSSLGSAAVSASAASISVGGFEVALSSLISVALAAVTVMAALELAIAGIAVAAAGAGAALAALLGGGLLYMGQQAAKQQQKLKSTLEGVKHVLGQIKEQAKQIFAPLANAQNAAMFQGVVAAMLTVLEDFVTMVQRLRSALAPLAQRIGEVFARTEPKFFRQLEKLIRAVLPYLGKFLAYMMTAIPAALQYLRENAVTLIPQLFILATSLVDLVAPLLEIAAAVGGVLIPVLVPFIDFLAGAATVISTVLVPVLQVLGDLLTWAAAVLGPVVDGLGALAGAFALVAGGSALLGVLSTLGGLAATLGTVLSTVLIPTLYALGSAMYAALGPWGILIGLAVAALSHFGLLDDVLGAVKAVLGAIASGTLGFISWLGGFVDWLKIGIHYVEVLLKKLDQLLGPLDEAVGKLVGLTAAAGDFALGGTDEWIGKQLSGGGGGSGQDTTGSSPSDDGYGRPPRPGGQNPYQGTGGDVTVNVDARGGTVDKGRIRQIVHEAVREAQKEQTARQGGSTS